MVCKISVKSFEEVRLSTAIHLLICHISLSTLLLGLAVPVLAGTLACSLLTHQVAAAPFQAQTV